MEGARTSSIHPSILPPSLPSFFKSGKEELEELTYADPMLHWDPLQLPGEPSYGPYRVLMVARHRNELRLIDAENEFHA